MKPGAPTHLAENSVEDLDIDERRLGDHGSVRLQRLRSFVVAEA
jgi:hypothetical protein